jgi:hypothetical protein
VKQIVPDPSSESIESLLIRLIEKAVLSKSWPDECLGSTTLALGGETPLETSESTIFDTEVPRASRGPAEDFFSFPERDRLHKCNLPRSTTTIRAFFSVKLSGRMI